MTHLLVFLIMLVLVYALVLNSIAWPDLLTGAILAGALLWATKDYLFPGTEVGPARARRLAGLALFTVGTLKETVSGTWRVLLIALRMRPLKRAGIVTIPMGERSDQGVIVTIFVMGFAPGSLLIDLDWERREMLFHMIDATDPDAIRDSFEQFYQRYQRPIFP